MYSTEKLIFEVQNYPCLWDISSKEYSDRDMKNSSWIKVAEAVYSTEWTDYGTAERGEKGKIICICIYYQSFLINYSIKLFIINL